MTKTEINARRMVINNYDVLDRVKLSGSQIRLYWSVVNAGKVTSQEVAGWRNISIQNATVQLKALFKAGYLMRSDAGEPTGGRLFEYSAITF